MIKRNFRAEKFQIINPTKRWDWDVPTLGQLQKSQIDFCDSIPKVNSAYHSESGNSFSDGFAQMLQLLGKGLEPYPLQSNLDALIKINNRLSKADPCNSDDRTPGGWSKVILEDGYLGWRKKWSTSSQPNKWERATAHKPLTTYELTFQEEGSRQPLGKMLLRAKDIEVISVQPGEWFSSSVFLLARSNPNYFTKGMSALFFGHQNAFLNSRILSFMVALMPTSDVLFTENTDEVLSEASLPELGNRYTYQPYIIATQIERYEVKSAATEPPTVVVDRSVINNEQHETITALNDKLKLVSDYKANFWAIGIDSDGNMDDFAKFFVKHDLPFKSFRAAGGRSIGTHDAYDHNIAVLRGKIKQLETDKATTQHLIATCEQLIKDLQSYSTKNWAIGLDGSTGKEDTFMAFFVEHGLPFVVYYVDNQRWIGDHTAYQRNIDMLVHYVKGLKA